MRHADGHLVEGRAEALLTLAQPPLSALAFGNVAGDRRGPHDSPGGIGERRDAHRDVDQLPALAPPHGFPVLDALALVRTPHQACQLLHPVGGHDQLDGLADGLAGGVAVEPLGGRVPAGDGSVQVLAVDRVVCGRDDGCQPAIGDVRAELDACARPTLLVALQDPAAGHRQAAPVRRGVDQLALPASGVAQLGLDLAQGQRELRRQQAVRDLAESFLPAPAVEQLGAPIPEANGAAVGIADHDRLLRQLQHIKRLPRRRRRERVARVRLIRLSIAWDLCKHLSTRGAAAAPVTVGLPAGRPLYAARGANTNNAAPGNRNQLRVAQPLQAELPGLRDQVVAEALVRLLLEQPKADAGVDVARRQQIALRPQPHLAVTGGTREADALVHQTAADAQPARLRLDQEQAQLADRLCRLDQKDASHTLAMALGDPAPLALGVEVIDESGDDAGHERLEVLVPAVLLGVQRAVPLDHPAHVAGAWLTQHAVAGARGRLAERELDGAHRLDQALLLGSGQVV